MEGMGYCWIIVGWEYRILSISEYPSYDHTITIEFH